VFRFVRMNLVDDSIDLPDHLITRVLFVVVVDVDHLGPMLLIGLI